MGLMGTTCGCGGIAFEGGHWKGAFGGVDRDLMGYRSCEDGCLVGWMVGWRGICLTEWL